MHSSFFDTPSNLDNVMVIIPVRNEEVTIKSVVQELFDFGLSRIRVVDNGSSDRSATIAQEAGAQVVFEPQAGYGQACWRGLENIPAGIEWILFADGDGSDDFNCLPQFFSLRNQYDLILGDRRATPQGKAVMSPVQHFGNGLASWLINLGWGHQYHDLGPLRLIRKASLEQIAMQDRGFGWTVEMQVRAIEEGLKICEIPVNYRPRQGGKSKISGTISGSIQAGTIILGTLAKHYLSSERNLESRQESKAKARGKILLWLSVLCLLSGAVMIAPYGDFRQSHTVLNFGYGLWVMSLGFIFSWGLKSLSFWWFWLIAIATRLIVLDMYPGSDVWRYIWEGYIQTLGFNPYDFAPNAPQLLPYRFSWWSQINHQGISAIYPPLSQLGFRMLAAISPSVILFKSSFAIADLLTCWLLTRKFSYLQTTLYAWNPLVIYSFTGGGHYDSWFILPLVAAWLWSPSASSRKEINIDNQHKVEDKSFKEKILLNFNSQNLIKALLVGASIAIKWISLPILAFIGWTTWRKVNLKTAILVIVCGILPILITALFFCDANSCHLVPTGSGFVKQGRIAEFLPRLLAKVWNGSTESNSIFAPFLLIAVVLLLMTVRNLQQFILGWFAALYLISPIIHVWYLTWIMPFAVGTNNWGVRLLSLSGCVYFVIPYHDYQRNLTDAETWLLWLPFIIGYASHLWRSQFKHN
ncbi:MAG: glycosyltransferase family 2 protein [Cyanobacteria bacterium P01_G01_bin.39]